MTARRHIGLPLLAALLVAAVIVDIARRGVERSSPPRPAAAPDASGASSGSVRAAESAGADTSGTLAAGVPATQPLGAVMRAALLRRIEIEGAGTYLPEMLAGGDSTLHRWADGRAGRPLRLGVLRSPVPGFREAFVANLGWAVSRWNGVGLPVFLEPVADTAGADIVVTWAERLDSNRAGRADVTWRRDGPITHVRITLATHTPDGRAVLPAQMVALALHELGHALGLGHSPSAADALHPQTSATELTERDRRTAVLLYSIPPGSLK